jgi:hypothetical protein
MPLVVQLQGSFGECANCHFGKDVSSSRLFTPDQRELSERIHKELTAQRLRKGPGRIANYAKKGEGDNARNGYIGGFLIAGHQTGLSERISWSTICLRQIRLRYRMSGGD